MNDWDLELYHQLEGHEETPARALEIVLETFNDYVQTRRQEITESAELQALRVEIEQAKGIFARFARMHQLPFQG